MKRASVDTADTDVSPPSVGPVAEPQDTYAVSAEFYDILQGEADTARVRYLYRDAVRKARVGVLDVGAGTGRVTLMSLVESPVPVHAVEPALSMRSALMTRLAALPIGLRRRVTVHPHSLGDAGLRGVADVAVCHNMLACLPPCARRELWPMIAAALTPGGSLLVQLPPARLPHRATCRTLRPQTVGQHQYGGRVIMSAETDRIRTRFDYWVRGANGVLRECDETFWMWPASRGEVIEDLAEYGFVPLPGPADPAILAVRRG